MLQQHRTQEQKAERLGKVVELAKKRLDPDQAEAMSGFLEAFYRRVTAEDILELTPENLYGAALSIWRLGASRPADEAVIRVYNPKIEEHGWKSPHTVIEVITDDMPFLVDSITAQLGRQNLNLHLVIHPVISVARDRAGERAADGEARRESVMHIEVDEQTDPAVLDGLYDKLKEVLADVRLAVRDWQKMLQALETTIGELEETAPDDLPQDDLHESRAFLEWVADNHFTLLGMRDYAYKERDGAPALELLPDTGLGILSNPERTVMAHKGDAAHLAPIVRHFLERSDPVLITKTSIRGHVHRAVHMDYIGVKLFNTDGSIRGERRIVGLFTSTAYSRTPRDIPLLRRKVNGTIQRAQFDPMSHDGKALLNILETYPRDELFQIDLDTLFEISTGILSIQERPRIKLFARRDPFERFFSCLIFVPRERYTTALRRDIGALLVEAFNGRVSNFYTQITDSPLARLHFIIGSDPETAPGEIDHAELQNRLVEIARSWGDDLTEALIERFGEEGGNRLGNKYGDAFPPSYTDTFNAELAVSDIEHFETMEQSGREAVNFYRLIEDQRHQVRFKIYRADSRVSLSDCLPMLENMGFRVIGETPHRLELGDRRQLWLHDFLMESASGGSVPLDRLKAKLEEEFEKVWQREVEDDGFNQLVVGAGLGWREVVVIRAICKYLRQAAIPFSQEYMEETLAANAGIARHVVDLFDARFNPALEGDREARCKELREAFAEALEQVASLDQDRILRRFANVVDSMLRTNFYQPGADGAVKPYVAFKLDSQKLDDLPLPRPFREIFVYSPRVEAVHLRGGKVARGGLRWSDRREDFRTEVLGLMKAQMVKNAVIVPVGSKGGFVTKLLPAGDRETVMAEVVACYKTFISGLLDVTDNLRGPEVVPPEQVLRYDEDDPYLVVAADKGTATFSDIANGVAIDYGFWLGDAFASGGAQGYDHKGMGITARGAWESVKRHFREIGRDIQNEDFTVIGIGDMSGDVFGNGMLLSKHIRLLAAFDHRDIFIDPAPDAARSWVERERLFNTPGTTWQDYDKKLISKGGGVFARSAKAIALSAEMKALTGLKADSVAPLQLINALLKAEADLLWIGGIGTYAKGPQETHADAGDRANDGLRVNGDELRFKVIGEGGNLGLTQRARIAYAEKGGRLNTDATDNAAGVDCSDHEVNIKILLDSVVTEGEMTEKQRNRLLAEMTDEVGLLVLQNNYLQTQALTLLEHRGADELADQQRFMRALERAGKLDRAIEYLPDDEEIAERLQDGRGLTRPELSVLLAYAKMTLYVELLGSDLIESRQLTRDMVKYFPRPLRRHHEPAILGHRLRPEIIATVTANSIANRMGITFVHDMVDETGLPPSAIARAYAVARDSFGLRKVWNAIESLDNRVPAAAQVEMHLCVQDLIRHVTLWFLRNLPQPIAITEALDAFEPGIRHLVEHHDAVLGDMERKAIASRLKGLVKSGVPKILAEQVAMLEPMQAACDIVHVAGQLGRGVQDVGRAYFALGATLGLDWLRSSADKVECADQWERAALAAIIDDFSSQQRTLTLQMLDGQGDSDADKCLKSWCKANRRAITRTEELLREFRGGGEMSISRLSVANHYIGQMLAS